MIYQTVLKDATILDNGSSRVYDIGIGENGIIQAVATGLDGRQEHSLAGLYVLPGLVDMHVHFRDFNQGHKETWYTGSRAAHSGGITYVGDMPNNDPPIITPERLKQKRDIAQRDSAVNFGLYFAVTTESLPYLQELASAVIAFKLFMGESTGGINYPYDRLPEAFEAVARTGKLLCVHAEDQRILDKGKEMYKGYDYVNHSLARPPSAEIEAIRYALKLSEEYGVPLHICHVTTKHGVELIREDMQRERNVTAETCPHYLLLSILNLTNSGPYAKMNPPLRCHSDQEELWRGITDGTIGMITSDHAPHTREEKDKGIGNIWNAPGGVPGVETTLMLMLDAVNKGRLTLPRLVQLMHDNPVERFCLERYGYMEEGNTANLTVVNLTEPWKIMDKDLQTKCRWSPYSRIPELFSGMGKATGVVINGELFEIC